MSNNPFRFNRPVSPDLFLGRTCLVQEMITDLADYQGDSHGIISGRRFGKSSVLLRLREHLLKDLDASESIGDWRGSPQNSGVNQTRNPSWCIIEH